MNKVIEAKSLVKEYGPFRAVNQISFQVQKGEIYGLLGPNGAGKSSLLRMLYCISPITSGDLYILGLNAKESPKKIKSLIGVVPQENGLDPELTVLESLMIYARYFGIKGSKALEVCKDLLRKMNLQEHEHSMAQELSGGMQRRLVIARALVNQGQVLFLDEPTTGLDPQVRQWIWDELLELRSQGVTIVLSTHYMEEAQYLCDRLLIMDKGKSLVEGRPHDLIDQLIGKEVVDFVLQDGEQDYYENLFKEKFEYQLFNRRMRIFLKDKKETKDVLEMVEGIDLVFRKPTLEDVFMNLAGREL